VNLNKEKQQSVDMQIRFVNLTKPALRVASPLFRNSLICNESAALLTVRRFSKLAAQTDVKADQSTQKPDAKPKAPQNRIKKQKEPFPVIPPAPKRIVAAVVLERLPVITPDPEPWCLPLLVPRNECMRMQH
jgi:hypothetical protein